MSSFLDLLIKTAFLPINEFGVPLLNFISSASIPFGPYPFKLFQFLISIIVSARVKSAFQDQIHLIRAASHVFLMSVGGGALVNMLLGRPAPFTIVPESLNAVFLAFALIFLVPTNFFYNLVLSKRMIPFWHIHLCLQTIFGIRNAFATTKGLPLFSSSGPSYPLLYLLSVLFICGGGIIADLINAFNRPLSNKSRLVDIAKTTLICFSMFVFITRLASPLNMLIKHKIKLQVIPTSLLDMEEDAIYFLLFLIALFHLPLESEKYPSFAKYLSDRFSTPVKKTSHVNSHVKGTPVPDSKKKSRSSSSSSSSSKKRR